jgi:hypothetical protein
MYATGQSDSFFWQRVDSTAYIKRAEITGHSQLVIQEERALT